MEIRDATVGEARLLEELQRRSSDIWPQYRDQLAAQPDVFELPQRFIENRWVRVAVGDNGDAVGFSVVIPMARGIHELDGLFVEPDEIGKGVGTALVEDAARSASARGATALMVTAGPAQPFYEKVRFVVVGEAMTRFGPAVRMRRPLNDEADRG